MTRRERPQQRRENVPAFAHRSPWFTSRFARRWPRFALGFACRRPSLAHRWLPGARAALALALALVTPQGLAADAPERTHPALGHRQSAGCAHEIAVESYGPAPALSKPSIQVVGGSRDPEGMRRYADLVRELSASGGILEQLGIANPPHIVEFMPSGELSVLASLGRHAVPHWHDGAQIAHAGRTALGVLEFVTPGMPTAPFCPQCRSFYSDTTKFEHQLSVIFHVAGHNDFAAHSPFCSMRPCDPVAESMALAEKVRELYETIDHDEVSRWYQYLQSLSNLQDLTRGTFEFPDKFDPKHAAALRSRPVRHTGERPADYAFRFPRRPSPSVLQGLVHNLSPSTPEWKKDLLARFERMERVLGYYTSTKIMNEGWASLMQELLPGYTSFSSSHDWFEYADLMQSVAYPQLSNPYWLGREAWRHLRKKFESRPEIRPLSQIEKDKKFIAWAHESVIGQMDDYDFLRFALDAEWIHKHHLYLTRSAQPDEYVNLPPPPQDGKQKEQKVVVSNDPKRVAQYIARMLADRTRQLPRIHLTDLNGLGRNAVLLQHEVFDQVPLERFSAAQALYVMAQVMDRPVAIRTVAASRWTAPKPVGPPPSPWYRPPPPEPVHTYPIRIECAVDGKITVVREHLQDDGSIVDTPEPLLTQQLQESVDEYRDDDMASVNATLAAASQSRHWPAVEAATDVVLETSVHSLGQAPTASGALLEFSRFFKSRLLRAIELVRSGKRTVRHTKRGVRLSVMPPIPQFQLDRRIAKALRNQRPPAPIDRVDRVFLTSSTGDPGSDDALDLGSGDRQPGDRYWGDRPEDGQGDGDEDGDPEDGDPQDGKGSGEPMDPTEVELPHDLFMRLLFDDFELPNRKPRQAGEAADVGDTREGGTHRPFGDVLWDRTIPAALQHGINARMRRKLPYRGISPQQLMLEGLKYLEPSDHVVADREPDPEPQYQAVIVYVIDLTGSMSGEGQALAKKWVAYVDELIRSRYQNVDVRFVGYSDSAFEFPRDKIFKAFIGGGNTDSTGFLLAEKILKEPKYGNFDKYVFGIGDGGSYDLETHRVQERLYEQCQYSGWVTVQLRHYGWSVPEFLDPMRRMAEQKPWFGYATLAPGTHSLIESIRTLFKQKRK